MEKGDRGEEGMKLSILLDNQGENTRTEGRELYRKGWNEEGTDRREGRQGMKLSVLLDDGGGREGQKGGRFRRC